jgi:hypothetical protein
MNVRVHAVTSREVLFHAYMYAGTVCTVPCGVYSVEGAANRVFKATGDRVS